MSLQAIAAAAVADGRRAAESLMVDTCLIRRKTGETTSTATGEVIATYVDVYGGKCRIQQSAGAHARTEDVGEAHLRLLRIEVHLPMSAVGLANGDIVEVTASALDPDLPGRKFGLRDLAHGTHKTARRIRAEELT